MQGLTCEHACPVYKESSAGVLGTVQGMCHVQQPLQAWRVCVLAAHDRAVSWV